MDALGNLRLVKDCIVGVWMAMWTFVVSNMFKGLIC